MTQIVMLSVPWWDHMEELNYASITLVSENSVDKRVARRVVRKWYKHQIGRSIPKYLIERVWKRRHVTRPMEVADIDNMLTEMAIASYNEHTNPDYKEEDTSGAGT